VLSHYMINICACTPLALLRFAVPTIPTGYCLTRHCTRPGLSSWLAPGFFGWRPRGRRSFRLRPVLLSLDLPGRVNASPLGGRHQSSSITIHDVEVA
jgi:hypothetical protein